MAHPFFVSRRRFLFLLRLSKNFPQTNCAFEFHADSADLRRKALAMLVLTIRNVYTRKAVLKKKICVRDKSIGIICLFVSFL